MTDLIHAPPNGWPVRRLYAFLSVDEGGEGICSAQMGLQHFPMVVSSQRALDTLKAQAVQISKASGKKVILVEFKRAAELWSTADGHVATPGS